MMDILENYKIEVEISKDEMSAFVKIIPIREGEELKADDILKALKNSGVVYGVDIDAVERIVREKKYNTNFLVAKGKEPVAGRDGEIRFYFELKKELKPKITEDGRVDFRELGYITNVLKGQLIAEKIMPTKGIPGYTVKGKLLPAKDGKEPKLIVGKNVVCSEDKTKFYSLIDGSPSFQDHKISVYPVMEIRDDIGPKTGNVEFIGSIKIYGNVVGGYRVKAQGDIEIEGYVESAEVISEGKVLIRGGVKGGNKGVVKAKSDVSVKFVENGFIEAGGNIYINEYAMHSVLIAGEKIKFSGKKGLLVGGRASAHREIFANTIGSHMATPTELEVGVNPFLNIKLQEIVTSIKNAEFELAKVERAILLFEAMKKANKLSQENYITLEKLYNTRASLKENLNELYKEKEKLEEELKNITEARITAKGVVYPGVAVKIGNAVYRVRDTIERAIFLNREGSIVVERII